MTFNIIERFWRKIPYGSELLEKIFLNHEFKPYKFDVVLDLGGGTGDWSKIIAPLVNQVILLDREEIRGGYQGSVAMAKTLLKEYKNIQFIIGDANNIPLKGATIDKIWCHQMLEHLDKLEGSFLEFARVLKRSGVCVISVPNSEFKKKYPYPLTNCFRKIFTSKIRKQLSSKLIGDFVKYGIENYELRAGHNKNRGWSLDELILEAENNNLKVKKFVTIHKKFGMIYRELCDVMPLIAKILKPLSIVIYLLEKDSNFEGENIIIKFRKEL